MRMLCAMVLLLAPVVLAGQEEEIRVRRGLQVELTPAPGALDLVSMLEEYDEAEWVTARRHLSGLKLYQLQMLPGWVGSPFLPNRIESLGRRALRNVRRNLELKLALEVGAMKPENCLFNPSDITRAVESTVQAVMNVYHAGGHVTRLDIDTSLGGHCGATLNDTAFAVGRWSMLVDDALKARLAEVRADYPVVHPRLAEIEPYPHNSAADHVTYFRKLNRDRKNRGYLPLEVYFLDIDHHLVDDARLARDFRFLVNEILSEGMKVGILMNGDDEDRKSPWRNKDLDYLRTVAVRLEKMKRLGVLDQADIVILQSWAMELSGARTVPRTVPDSGLTLTNFLLHMLRCMEGSVVCGAYP